MKELDRAYQAIDRLTRWLIGAAFLLALLLGWCILENRRIERLEAKLEKQMADIEGLDARYNLQKQELGELRHLITYYNAEVLALKQTKENAHE